MEGLRPPFISRDAEPGYGSGVVCELLDFLGKGEERDEGVSSGCDGKSCVAERVSVAVWGFTWVLGMWALAGDEEPEGLYNEDEDNFKLGRHWGSAV